MNTIVRPGRGLAVTAGGTLLAMTAFTAPLSIVPSVTADLGAGPVATSWVLSSMSLGLAVALLTSGAIGDEAGHRRVFVAGAALLVLGSAVCGLAPGPVAFVAGRIVEGVGAAAVISCGLALISHTVTDGPERTRATGIWGACMGAGPAVGPLLGAVSDVVASWRLAYLVITVLAVALAVAGQAWLSESRSDRHRGVDIVGAVLLGLGTACLLAALTEGRQSGLGAFEVGLIAGAVVFLAAFGVHQARARNPMLEYRLFRRPALVSATLAAFVTGAGIIALMSFISTVLERGLGHTAVVSAAILLTWSGTSVIAALSARRLPVRVSGGARMGIGLLVLAAGLVPVAVLDRVSATGQIMLGLVVAGAGTGLVNATLGREAVASVPPTSSGAGSGINNTARYVGAAFGVTVVTVLAQRPAVDPTAGLLAGWDLAVLLGIGLCVAGALGVLLLQRADTRLLARGASAPGRRTPASRPGVASRYPTRPR